MSKEYKYVGKSMPFLWNKEKATGQVKYTVDVKVKDALFGKLFTSPHPHALIKSMDISEAEKMPGVHAVITFEDIPKMKINPSIQKWMHHHPAFDTEDMYIIGDKARFIGEIIGAVAAVDELTAIEAIKRIQVEYEVLPAAFNMQDAVKPGQALVHNDSKDNIGQVYDFMGNHGDTEAAFKEAAVVVGAKVMTSRQHVMALEPLTTTAKFDLDGSLTVWTSVQRPMTFRKQIAELFKMPEGSVNVVCEHAGGFFGEGNFPPVPIAVALAKKAKRPVRLEFTREDMVYETPTREVFLPEAKLGFAKDGTLLVGAEHLLVDSGAYFNRSNATANPQMGAFGSVYRMPAFKATMEAIYSNTPATGGSRGYGGPQAVLILEHLMDKAASELGIDRLDIRSKNFKGLEERAIQYPWEVLTQEEVMRSAAEKFGYEEKKKRSKADGVYRRGIGVTNYLDVSGGQPSEIMDRHCMMLLEEDGTVIIQNNHPDGGMNLLGASTQIAAEVSGIRFEDFRHIHGETKGAPYDMGLAANSGMYGMGNLMAKAGAKLKEEILSAVANRLEKPVENLDIIDSNIVKKDDGNIIMTLKRFADTSVYNHHGPSEQIVIKESFCPVYNPSAVGSVFADVKVDMETGDVKVEKLLLVHDCGRAINPMGVEGQLQGGMLLGYGYAMFEDLHINQKTGKVDGNNFNKYKIASTLDLPDMEAVIFEGSSKTGPFGAKGVGMSGTMGIAGAIANALYDATGVWVEEMPFTPERVLAAIKKQSN